MLPSPAASFASSYHPALPHGRAAFHLQVTNITQCLHLLHLGDRNRTTAFTALNAHSSRSHAVVMLTVIKRRAVSGTGEAEIQRVKVGGWQCGLVSPQSRLIGG